MGGQSTQDPATVLLQQRLNNPPAGMGPSDIAKRNTDLLTKWSGWTPPKASSQADQGAPSQEKMMAMYEKIAQAAPAPDYSAAQKYIPYFKGLNDDDMEMQLQNLRNQVGQRYQGQDRVDELRAVGDAYWMAGGR